MARARAKSTKPTTGRPRSGGKRGMSRQQKTTSSGSVTSIASLRGLIASRQQNPLEKYWDLGTGAADILGRAESARGAPLSAPKLAKQVGLKDATLRQAIKFASKASRPKAARLQKAGVPWRGVVYWLGVEDERDSQQLYQRMVSGLSNSTDIRQYIADNFAKQAAPRFSESLTEACQKVQTRVERLIVALDGFERAHEQHWTSLSPADRKKARSSLRDLDKALRTADDLIRSVRAKAKARR